MIIYLTQDCIHAMIPVDEPQLSLLLGLATSRRGLNGLPDIRLIDATSFLFGTSFNTFFLPFSMRGVSLL